MVSLTSVELNFLVFRYLQESGFIHSAFVFGYEAAINKSPIDGDLVPPVALITVVQKGLLYVEMEANLTCQIDSVSEDDFSIISAIDLLTKSPEELYQMVKEKRGKLQNDKDNKKDKEIDERRVKGKEIHETKKHGNERAEGKEQDKKQEKRRVRKFIVIDDDEESLDINPEPEVNRVIGAGEEGPVPMDISIASAPQPFEVSCSDITILEGHSSEVCTCAWSPTGPLLASGSKDSTARIWSIIDGSRGSGMKNVDVYVLKHVNGITDGKFKEVTALDWNQKGTLLASGSSDGQARIWNLNGELKSTLTKHKGPVFSVKWNKSGDYLLTGSFDRTAILWDMKSEQCKQQFKFHTGPTLDVDWRNNVSFATSSVDTMIHVCQFGVPRPIKTFAGHQAEVNCVKWDPSGILLASCSDDKTAKIWSLEHASYVHDLRKHCEAIYTIKWSPTGPGTVNPNKQLVLASASFDSTVKIWDVVAGKLQRSLNGHSGYISSIAFSPDGEYLASGSADRCLHIWSLKEHKIVKTYKGTAAVYEVCWNKDGNKIAGCFANNAVCVLDCRMWV